MKTEKKRVGTKAEIRAIKNRERRIATAIFLVFTLLIVIFSSYFTYNFLDQPQNQTTNPASSQLKAAIVDQLSLTFPNQTFIETATNTLKQAGYTVDYYPGEQVTVEFYRNLPTSVYRIIILRVHSTATVVAQGAQRPVSLFTSEPYSMTKYVYEQLTEQIAKVAYNFPDPPYYFAVAPAFVVSAMKDRFHDAIIIMMGCEGLDNPSMAKAFVEKGAKTYISWNGSVLASYTDQAVTHLLQQLFTKKETLEEAVDNTMSELGPDPEYKSQLLYYPLEVGDQTIENIKR